MIGFAGPTWQGWIPLDRFLGWIGWTFAIPTLLFMHLGLAGFSPGFVGKAKAAPEGEHMEDILKTWMWAMNKDGAWLFRVCRGWETTQLCGDSN